MIKSMISIITAIPIIFLVQTKDKIYKSKLLTYKQIIEDKDVIFVFLE